MQINRSITAFVTLFAFMFNGVPIVAQADVASATSSSATIPNYVASTLPLLNGTQNTLNQTAASCDAQFPVEDAASNLFGIASNAATKLANARNKTSKTTAPGGSRDCSAMNFSSSSSKGGVKSDSPWVDPTGVRRYAGNPAAGSASTETPTCDLVCDAPLDLMDGGSCDAYYTEDAVDDQKTDAYLIPGGTVHNPIEKDGDKTYGLKMLAADQKKVSKYVEYLQWKSTTCSDEATKKLTAQYANYKCKTDALGKAVSDAAGQLQTALSNNSQSFTKMIQFQSQVGEQMTQIDEILGPDPSDPNAKSTGNSQFGGLLGVQAALNKELPAWTASDATNKTTVTKITQEYVANDQALTANKMTVVSDCMQGTTNLNVAGGRSLMCYKASTTTNKDGTTSSSSSQTLQPCGAIDFLKSQIYQAEIKNSGNQRSNSVLQVAAAEGAAFDSLMRSMLRDLGANDPTDKTTSSKILNTRISDWATLQSKYAANIKEIGDKSGVNLSQQLAVVGQNCFNESNTWYNQQKSSAGSSYNQKVQAIDAEKNDLSSKMTSDLSAMSGEFSSAVAVMGGVGNYSCADSSTIDKQQKCNADIRTKLTDLLSGNGSAGNSTKAINGGSLVAGFNVSCRGINMCVNTYKAVRTQKKTQLTNAKKATEDFVTSSNNAIQNQLQIFAKGLSTLQQSVSAQFANMQLAMTKLGIESTASPKYTDPEQLQPGGSEKTGPGPFQNPKNMTAVLSGLVQPTGLINFQNSGGVQDLMAEVKKQGKKDQEKSAETARNYQKGKAKLDLMSSTCKKGDKHPAATSAASTDTKAACAMRQTLCTLPLAQPAIDNILAIASPQLASRSADLKCDATTLFSLCGADTGSAVKPAVAQANGSGAATVLKATGSQ